jgi:thiamine biosynthesis lipoprotein
MTGDAGSATTTLIASALEPPHHVPIEERRLPTRDPRHRRAERLMGTVVSLLAPDGGADSAAADAAFAWLHEAEARFSPFRPESEVGRLISASLEAAGRVGGREGSGVPEPSPELAEILELCDAIEALSDGAFDIRRHRADRAPDPTGVVKGWAVDRAGDILAAGGIERFCLNAGGDVLARGGRAPGVPLRIGVPHPATPGTFAVVLGAEHLAVATSGTTERGRHIVDARSGSIASGLLLATVVGPALARADAYATAAFAMGIEGLRWCESLPGYAACGVAADGRVLSAPGVRRFLARG